MTYLYARVLPSPRRGPPFVEKIYALGGARTGSPNGVPRPSTAPGRRPKRSPSAPPDRLVGVVEAPDVPDVDLVEELRIPRVFVSPTNS